MTLHLLIGSTCNISGLVTGWLKLYGGSTCVESPENLQDLQETFVDAKIKWDFFMIWLWSDIFFILSTSVFFCSRKKRNKVEPSVAKVEFRIKKHGRIWTELSVRLFISAKKRIMSKGCWLFALKMTQLGFSLAMIPPAENPASCSVTEGPQAGSRTNLGPEISLNDNKISTK